MKCTKKNAASRLSVCLVTVILVTVSFAFAKRTLPSNETYGWSVYIPVLESLGLQGYPEVTGSGEYAFEYSQDVISNFANVTRQKGNYWSSFLFSVSFNGGDPWGVILKGIEGPIVCDQGDYCDEMFAQIGMYQPNGGLFGYPNWGLLDHEADSERILISFVSYANFNFSEQEIGESGQKRLARGRFTIDSEPISPKVANNHDGQIMGEFLGDFYLTRISEDEWRVEGDVHGISARQYQVVDMDQTCWGKKTCQDIYVSQIVAEGHVEFQTATKLVLFFRRELIE